MTHAPPYRALEAFHVGTLRPSHRDVLARHLEGCEPCRTALACVGAYERVSGELRAYEPEVDWARVNEGVSRVIKRRERDRRILAVTAGALAVAAATLLVAWPSTPRSTPRTHAASPAPTSGPSARTMETTGTLHADGVVLTAHAPDLRGVRDGSTLHAVEGSAHVGLARGTGFTLAEGTEVTVESARAPFRIALASGRVTSEVEPGTPYEVHAGAYVVRVKGTRFDVTRAGSRVAVHLHSGRVEVVEHGISLGVLVAPATWTSPEAAAPDAEEAAPEPAQPTRTRPAAEPVPSPTPPTEREDSTSDGADVVHSMRSQSGRLGRCIADDAEQVSLTIHFSVSITGAINDVSVSSRSEVPTPVSDCILRTVQSLRVPAPDEPVDLSVTLALP